MEHRQFDPLCPKPNWKLEQLGSFRVLPTLAASGVGLTCRSWPGFPGIYLDAMARQCFTGLSGARLDCVSCRACHGCDGPLRASASPERINSEFKPTASLVD